jgi:ubiquinone/menaquinone biosynthesis C-methylase UbiE
VRCDHCAIAHPMSPAGVIDFAQKKTEQSAFFDTTYASGHLHKIDELNETSLQTYQNSVGLSLEYLKMCGRDPARPLENLSVLDVACGAGWVTAGLLQHPAIRNCRLHAFDISPHGPESLARFQRTLEPANCLEMSVQDAAQMSFAPESFDIVIGSSVLHHFDDVETFLIDCRRILKPGGAAVFGEPFAIGYALGVAALMIAQRQLGTHHQALEDLYTDIGYRIKSPPQLLANLIDKHLFFQSSFLELAQHVGFAKVQFISLSSRDYYRDHFIEELLSERSISDPQLASVANEIYRTTFDLFDSETFIHSAAAFIQIVLHV